MNMTVIMVIGLIVVLAIILFLMRGRKTPPAQTPPVRKPPVTHQPNTPVPSDAKPTSPASAARRQPQLLQWRLHLWIPLR